MEHVVHGFEIVGIAVLAVGVDRWPRPCRGTVAQGDEHAAYRRCPARHRPIDLARLEILIIADIVLTITIDPTLESALALCLVVPYQTFLSFSLEIELDGVLRGTRAGRRNAPRHTAGPAP